MDTSRRTKEKFPEQSRMVIKNPERLHKSHSSDFQAKEINSIQFIFQYHRIYNNIVN